MDQVCFPDGFVASVFVFLVVYELLYTYDGPVTRQPSPSSWVRFVFPSVSFRRVCRFRRFRFVVLVFIRSDSAVTSPGCADSVHFKVSPHATPSAGLSDVRRFRFVIVVGFVSF